MVRVEAHLDKNEFIHALECCKFTEIADLVKFQRIIDVNSIEIHIK